MQPFDNMHMLYQTGHPHQTECIQTLHFCCLVFSRRFTFGRPQLFNPSPQQNISKLNNNPGARPLKASPQPAAKAVVTNSGTPRMQAAQRTGASAEGANLLPPIPSTWLPAPATCTELDASAAESAFLGGLHDITLCSHDCVSVECMLRSSPASWRVQLVFVRETSLWRGFSAGSSFRTAGNSHHHIVKRTAAAACRW